MRRLLLALMLAASLVGAQDGSFVGPPPPEQCVSKGGHIRWTGVLGDRRLKHPNDVYALAVTERAVVVGGAFEAIKIWDLESGKEIRTLEGHANGTAALAVSRDGNRLYSLGMDQIVKIWDPRSGKLLRTLVGTERKQSVFEWRPGGAMVLAPDESYLVTGSQERAVRLCDVATGKVRHLGGREADVESLAVDREGRWIAYADGDGLSVRILDRLSGDLVRTLTPATSAALGRFERGIRSVAFSPDGRWLVSGRVDGTLHVWDVRSGEELRALTGHESVVGAVAFNGDGTRMVSADWDGVLRVWDTERWESIRTARAGNWIRAVAVSPDGSRFASGGLAGVVRVWNWEGDLLCPTGKGHIAPITSLAVSADGKVIYSASRDETIAIWDTGSGNRTAVVDVAPYKIGHIECTALSADGRLLATGASEMGAVGLWETEGRTLRHQLRSVGAGDLTTIQGVAFSPDGKNLYGAAGSREGLSITIWDAAAGTVAGRHRCETDSDVEALATTCGGGRLVALRPRAGILSWDVATGKERRIDTSDGRALKARSLAVAPSGQWFVTGGQDGKLIIWDAETLKEARALQAHDNAVAAVTLSPDGRLVCSVGDDDWMCLWDVATGGEVDRIRVDGLPTCAVMSDSRIWLGCRDSTIRAYEYKPQPEPGRADR